jgi:uncharacterized glyoxalase superfamily protein PhnB
MLPTFALEGFDWRVDQMVIVFSAALAIGTGLLFGLFPAIHSTRPELTSSLKGQAGQPAGARAAARFRASLATAQIALSMALLVAAGLFTKSLMNISRVDLGIQVDHVITFGVSPALNGHTPDRTRQLFEQLEDQLAAEPGVIGVTGSVVPLLAGNNWGYTLKVEGFQAGPNTDTNARYNEIGPGYLGTLFRPVGPASFAGAARTVTPVLHVQGAADYAEFLKRALGAVEEMRRDEGGRLQYAKLGIGDGAVELSEGDPMPGSFLLYIPDPDARYQQALAAGATSLMPPADQPYGRMGGVEDARGNQWFFSRPVPASG